MAKIVRMQQDFTALLLGAAALWLSQAACAEHGEAVTVLVANRGFDDAAYAQAVVVLQRDGSEEVGVIINRPSDYALANVLDAPAAAKASDPLYSGGPFLSQQLIALIRDEKSPGEGSMQLARGLHLSIGAAVLQRAVERSSGTAARYYAGLVLWQPGELADELKRGLWLKLEVPLDTVFRRDATGLWDELLLAAQAVRT
jgi:putative transcriptional regulator